MSDWGVHLLDYALEGMGADLPSRVFSGGGKFAYRFHACFFSGNDRDDFPTGAGEYQCAVFTEEGQTFFFVERTVVDTAGMIPDDIEIFVGVCSHQCIGRLHCIIGIGELATSGEYAAGQIGSHAFERIIQTPSKNAT